MRIFPEQVVLFSEVLDKILASVASVGDVARKALLVLRLASVFQLLWITVANLSLPHRLPVQMLPTTQQSVLELACEGPTWAPNRVDRGQRLMLQVAAPLP